MGKILKFFHVRTDLSLCLIANQHEQIRDERKSVFLEGQLDNFQDLQSWMSGYLYNPTKTHAVNGTVLAASLLSRDYGRIDTVNMSTVLAVTTFISRVWCRWPDEAEGWFVESLEQTPSGDSGRMRARAVIYLIASICPPVASKIDDIVPKGDLDKLDLADAKGAREIFGSGLLLEERKISAPGGLDMLWGAFFGSGDEKYVRAVLGCVQWANPKKAPSKSLRELGRVATWSLSSNRTHNMFAEMAMGKIFAEDPKLEKEYEEAVSIWML